MSSRDGLMISFDTIIEIVLALLLGGWLGYSWRDRISKQRRRRAKAERDRERHAALEREKLP